MSSKGEIVQKSEKLNVVCNINMTDIQAKGFQISFYHNGVIFIEIGGEMSKRK